MRKLDRSAVACPVCLANYQHGRHKWDDVSSNDKKEIHTGLEQMQGRRCAYCEGDLDVLGWHIEHFRRKRDHVPLTFDWSNLYWSCDQTDSCGHFKDRGGSPYIVDDLLNPCHDDPDIFMKFRFDGTISISPGLSDRDGHRIEETLRVFALDPCGGRLRNMRKRMLSGYITIADDVKEMKLTPEEAKELLSEELATAANLPFSTAIRHVLTESA